MTGGDLRSGRVEAQAALILWFGDATPDVRIEEPRRDPEREHGFGFSTIPR